ncbi:homeobox protein abdominal-A-like [Anastrepha obliqua]|uniref:homeobox protein abdominal-A-like n=1 Tax=Anastrepha obliqua TaxID=95512 RepID=UPI0024095739|nr:homeobox protein abdominal-A-like [Anastrepha obliqua]
MADEDMLRYEPGLHHCRLPKNAVERSRMMCNSAIATATSTALLATTVAAVASLAATVTATANNIQTQACMRDDRASCSTNITDRRPSDIMANGDCYRRLSNSSSAVYGSCPQLTQYLDSSQQQQQHCPHLNPTEQEAQQAQHHYQSIHQQPRQYSSLVRPRQSRSPVLSARTAKGKAAKEAKVATTTAVVKPAPAPTSSSLAFVSFKPAAASKTYRAQQLQQELPSSVATPAVTASRYLCRRCRFNNQPVTCQAVNTTSATKQARATTITRSSQQLRIPTATATPFATATAERHSKPGLANAQW